MHNLLNDAAQRALRYLDELDARSVAPSAEAVQGLIRFHEPLPEKPTEPRDVLALLDDSWEGEYWCRDQAVHGMKRKQRADLANYVDDLRGIERKVPPSPVYGFNCHFAAVWAALCEIGPLPDISFSPELLRAQTPRRRSRPGPPRPHRYL